MIVHSLNACSDPLYRSMLYDMLLKGHVDTLLDLVPSQHAEEYLEGKEPDLLYRYGTACALLFDHVLGVEHRVFLGGGYGYDT
jgi:hypothetical protein